jgi:hypothetical protein
MPDHWGFVAAAYAVTAIILGGYWRMLARKEHALASPGTGTRGQSEAGARSQAGARTDPTIRSREPSKTAPPRPEPASRPPLP